MKKWMVPAAALLFGCTAQLAPAADLNVGDPAPKLAVKQFVKGDPIKGLENGKLYVVEFWATWCGPCRKSAPHLSELQKKHKDVTFVGVSLDDELDTVKSFVKEMGDQMAYRVALDDGAMAKTWMAAAGQDGIPSAFIVNGEGKIAWIGHPMAMDKPLEQIASGKWDLAAAARKYKAEMAPKRKYREVQAKLAKAEGSGDPKEVAAVVERALDDLADYAEGLNFVAWTVIDPDSATKPDAKLLKLALKAAQRADDLVKGQQADIADTLAKAYFDNGNAAKAVETQERAVKLAEGTPLARDPDLKRRLEQYQKAARKKE
jgi:thiol-disulfide isomerase/thioredoxin